MRCHVCYEQVISIKYGSYWDRNHFRFVSTVSDIPYYCGSPMWSLCSLKTLPLIKEWLYHTWGNFWTYFLRSFKFSRCPYPLFTPPIFPLLFSSLSFFTFPSCFYFLILLSNFTSFFPDFSLPPLFNCIFFNLNFCFCLTGTQYKIKSSINFLTLPYFIKIKALKIYLQFLLPFCGCIQWHQERGRWISHSDKEIRAAQQSYPLPVICLLWETSGELQQFSNSLNF